MNGLGFRIGRAGGIARFLGANCLFVSALLVPWTVSAETQSADSPRVEIVEVESTPMVKTVHDVMPVYPKSMKKRGIEGAVTLAYQIDKRGKAKNFRVIDAEPTRIFVRSAMIALKKSRFEVTQRDGRPVAVRNQSRRYVYSMDSQQPYVAGL